MTLIAIWVSSCTTPTNPAALSASDPLVARRARAEQLRAAGKKDTDNYRAEEAAEKYRQALQILEAADGAGSSSLGPALRGLAAAARIQCDAELARSWLQKAERVARFGEEAILVNRSYAILGDWIGDGNLAWARILRANQVCRETLGAHIRCIVTLVDSAEIAETLGYLNEGKARLEAALAELTDEPNGRAAAWRVHGMYLLDQVVFHLNRVYGLLGEETRRQEFEQHYRIRHVSSDPGWPSRDAFKGGSGYCRSPLSRADIERRVALRRTWMTAVQRCYRSPDTSGAPGIFTSVAYQPDGRAIAAEVQARQDVTDSALSCVLEALLAQQTEPFDDGIRVGFYTYFSRAGSSESMGD